MKTRLLTFCLCIASFNLFAQDNLILKSGEELQVKVIEIGLADITYKKLDNLTGPDYVVSKRDVFMIKYENGTKDVFTSIDNPLTKEDTIKTKSSGIQLKYYAGGHYSVTVGDKKQDVSIFKMDTIFKNTTNPDIYKYYSFGKQNYRGRKARFAVGLIMTLAGLATTGYGVYAIGEYNKNTNPANTSKYGFKPSTAPWGDAINTTESYSIPLAGGIIVSNIGLAMFSSAIITISIKDRKLKLAGELYNQENK